MEKGEKKSNLLIVIIIAVLLIFGAWFVFSLLNNKEIAPLSNDEIIQEAKIRRIKLLAEKNLEYFPLESTAKSILEKVKDDPQYQGLDLEINTFINTKTNLGNSYPFANPEAEVQK
ncbi:hypothetical protein H6761_02485 [Candidatus Nomurabacteria bacterium]|nr:hypothetical protein [Candidatus Nomurabacteria bacterium]